MGDPGTAPLCADVVLDAAGELHPAKIRATPRTAQSRTIRLFIRGLPFGESAPDSAHAIPS
jgi:hypothetical protein